MDSFLKESKKNRPVLFWISSYLLIAAQIVFCLPTHLLICILISMIIGDPALGYIFIYFSSVTTSLFISYPLGTLIKSAISKWLSESWLIEIFREESRSQPLITSLLVRFLFITYGLKDYILILINNPLDTYLVSCLICNLLFSLEAILVITQFWSIKDYIKWPESWSEKSTPEKIMAAFFLLLLIFTFVFAFLLSKWINKKIKEKEEIKKRDELNI